MKQERKALWKNSQNLREFFDEFAKTKGFNPLAAENWYPVKFADILKKRVSTQVFAILDLYFIIF